MRHLPHLMARLFNVPLLIDPGKASAIYQGLSARLGIEALGEVVSGPGQAHRQRERMAIPGAREAAAGHLMTQGGIAVVTVSGTLVHNAAGSDPLSGLTSYTDIRNQIDAAAADPSARAILIDADTPGGEGTDSAFALSARIRELRSVKPVWAICDEMACSAGYLVCSGAEKMFAPALGYTGSIGVYMALLNVSEAEKMQGLEWTFIKAGAHKLDGCESLPFGKEFLERMQADVDATYARFLAEVGANRPGLGIEGARKTEARFYRGSEAAALGLTDGIMDFPAVLQALTDRLSSGSIAARPTVTSQVRQEASAEAAVGDVSPKAAAAAPNQETNMTTENKDVQQPAPAATQQPGNVVDINAARKEGGDAARKEMSEIVELCTLAGKPGLAAGFIAGGKSVADVRKDLLADKAKTDTEINTQHGPQPGAHAAGGNVLIGECERLAKLSAKKSA